MARAGSKEPKAKILDDGTLMLFGVIGDSFDELEASRIVQEIRSFRADETLRVLINSPGGFVSDGLAIYNALANRTGRNEVEIAGVAASMASVIAMAGNHVSIPENGMVMIHDPWEVAVGDAEDLRKAAETLEKFGDSLAGIYARKTGLPEDEIREMMRGETWLDAHEALKKGFVDEVLEPAEAAAFADVDVSELKAVPDRLVALIRRGRQMARTRDKETKVSDKQGTAPETTEAQGQQADETWEELVEKHGAGVKPGRPTMAEQRDRAAAEAARAAERQRWSDLKAIAEPYPEEMIPSDLVDRHIALGTSSSEFREVVLKILAAWTRQNGPSSNARVTVAEQDKFIQGAGDWLIVRSGNRALVEQAQALVGDPSRKLDPGEFRGMTLLELARESLGRAGVRTRGMSKMELAAVALNLKGPRSSIVQTPSDFPVLLENVLNKMLQAAYAITPDTWRSFTRSGTVTDFRDNLRLRLGTLGRLDELLPSGEFRHKNFPDADKESIRAATVGNIVGISRQAIVNDDVDGFSRIITMLGRAAMLSVESQVFDVLGENSGLGPTMRDGKTLFHADHGNIAGTAAAPSVDAFEAARVLMAQQQDPEGNELLDLRPAAWVGPIGLGGEVRVIVTAEFDFASETSGMTGQFRKPNKVRDFVSTIVDTARLSGTRWYLFADPAITPTLEVVFLDGQESPVLETQEGFDFDGIRWRVRHDFGVDATDFRPAITNAGA